MPDRYRVLRKQTIRRWFAESALSTERCMRLVDAAAADGYRLSRVHRLCGVVIVEFVREREEVVDAAEWENEFNGLRHE